MLMTEQPAHYQGCPKVKCSLVKLLLFHYAML